MARRRIQGSRVLVTGASSGIGRALVRELARHGAHLVVTARRRDALESLLAEVDPSANRSMLVAGDITSAAVRQQCLDAASQWGGIDILVNNAGVGAVGPFLDADRERLRRVMEVNFFAPLELIRSALPTLRQGERPMIVNVGSVLGHRAVPNKSEYCASKFALHGFSDALRAELAPSGIDVLLVSPSTTDSEFFDNVLDRPEGIPSLVGRGMSAAAVARKSVSAMRRGRHEIILSWTGNFAVWCDRLFPSLMDRIVARFG